MAYIVYKDIFSMKSDNLSDYYNRHEQLHDLQDSASGAYMRLQHDYESQQITLKQKQLELVEYKTQAHYWEAQFKQQQKREIELKAELKNEIEKLQVQQQNRETELKNEIEKLQAQLRQREHQLFGKKSEKTTKRDAKPNELTNEEITRRKRGQQPGSKGHSRRDYSHLDTVDEDVSLLEENAVCSCCHLPYEKLPDTEDAEVLEIMNVRAYRRAIHRKKYKRTCRCPENKAPQIITPPPMERVIPKSIIGVSIWALLIMQKYVYQQPLNRSLKQLSDAGLELSAGTITDGMQKLLPLLIPIYDAIVEYSLSKNHWHADETGWKVFETTEEKKSQRWYLWIFRNPSTVVFKIAPSRSAKVLLEHFGENHEGGVLNVDRYSAYKVIAKEGLFVLAFCWAHVRRDFLDYARAYSEDEAWAMAWIDKIAELYHINNQRIKCKPSSKTHQRHSQRLKTSINKMREQLNDEIDTANVPLHAKAILKSLQNHWEGLTVFVECPEIPMDNNLAESGLRPAVVGRKNYYGSGAIWAAELAATLFTILQTIALYDINQHLWLLAYLQACAEHQGQPPDDINVFLPWQMSARKRQLFSQPPVHEPPMMQS